VENEKNEINPIHREYKYMLSPRCGAKTRKQTLCLSPATHGKKRCRMHGGAKGSGAPKGNRNALKDGYTTREAKAERQEIRALIKLCREFIDEY
jgi:glucans biosynthesis protein